MLPTRKALVTALTVMVLAFGFATTATAATRPSTPSVAALSAGQARLTSYTTAQQPAAAANITMTKKCTDGSSGGNVTTCLTTYHRGRYVETMRVSGCVHHSARWLSVLLVSKSGVLAGPPFGLPNYIIPGSCEVFAWNPFATVPAGTYCAQTYRFPSSSGTGTLIGKACIKL